MNRNTLVAGLAAVGLGVSAVAAAFTLPITPASTPPTVDRWWDQVEHTEAFLERTDCTSSPTDLPLFGGSVPANTPFACVMVSSIVKIPPVGINRPDVTVGLGNSSVFGVLRSTTRLGDTDGLCGNELIAYPDTDPDRGLEGNERVVIEDSPSQVKLFLDTTVADVDQVRIVVECPNDLAP